MTAPRTLQATMRMQRDDAFDICRTDTAAHAGQLLAEFAGDRPTLVVADAICRELFPQKLDALLGALPQPPRAMHFVDARAQGGETKDVSEVLAVIDCAIECDLPRDGIIVAVGGGSTMDVAGLAAQLYRRMVEYVRVPTTLIGQVDAGVGLKVGINYRGKKNIIGAYHAPSLVVNCLEFLESLDDVNLRAGLSEILKVGIAASPAVLDALEALTWPNPQVDELAPLCDEAVRVMCDQLMMNPYERGDLRRAMDFGHTFGPTIEELSDYRVPHGFAVAVDMHASCQIARRLGLIDDKLLAEYEALFERFGLLEFGTEYAAEAFERGIESSIAHRAGNLNYVLPNGRGTSCFVNLDTCRTQDPTLYARILTRDRLLSLACE